MFRQLTKTWWLLHASFSCCLACLACQWHLVRPSYVWLLTESYLTRTANLPRLSAQAFCLEVHSCILLRCQVEAKRRIPDTAAMACQETSCDRQEAYIFVESSYLSCTSGFTLLANSQKEPQCRRFAKIHCINSVGRHRFISFSCCSASAGPESLRRAR